jgi:nucleoside-diphosphate-sugar epimerase
MKRNTRCPKHYNNDGYKWINSGEIKNGDFIAISKFSKRDLSTHYSNDMMRLFGYYLAEGCINKSGLVRLTFNEKETEYITDVERIVKKELNKNCGRYYQNNGCQISFCGKNLYRLFSQFGQYSFNKRIPSWVFNINDESKIEQLLIGYFNGDGCFMNGKLSSVSEILVYQLRLLFGIINMPVSLDKYNRKHTIINNKTYKSRESFQITLSKLTGNRSFKLIQSKRSFRCFIKDDFIFYRVKGIKKYYSKEDVFNLSVNNDNTYNIFGYTVHNCAALKHVGICENQPREALKTNILGTQNVIDACISNKVSVCINISSDKACNVNPVYGQTKAIAERLITEANNQTLDTDFFSVRSGNILGSAGSVIPIWIKQIAEHNCIYLTNPLMTRFFITVQDAVSLTLKAMNKSDRGEVFVFRMPSFYMQSLAELIVDYYGDSNTKIKKLDPRPGESINELLVTEHEAERTLISKDYFIVYPLIDVKTATYPKITNVSRIKHEYSSGDVAVNNQDELLKLVQKAGYCL